MDDIVLIESGSREGKTKCRANEQSDWMLPSHSRPPVTAWSASVTATAVAKNVMAAT